MAHGHSGEPLETLFVSVGEVIRGDTHPVDSGTRSLKEANVRSDDAISPSVVAGTRRLCGGHQPACESESSRVGPAARAGLAVNV